MFRRSVIAGALIAMRMIDAAAVAGVALALGRSEMVAKGFGPVGIDLAIIVCAGLLAFGAKQAFVHRRGPLHRPR